MDDGALCYRRYLNGDEKAFNEIVDLYYRNLVYFLTQIVKNVSTAEDIAIDAFADLVVHKNRYNFKVSLKTYLFMIGKSRAIDWLRHEKSLREDALESANEMTNSDEAILQNIVVKTDLQKYVQKCLTTLPEEMQQVLHLLYFEEMSYKEVSLVMKKNLKQVDNLAYRAKLQLKQIMGKEGESYL